MWFMFGFITLISASIYMGYKRINAAWTGTRLQRNGISFQYDLRTHKNKTKAVLIGIDGKTGYDFSLKPEGALDRFSKFMGMSVEHQIGSKDFDDSVYIVSDNPQLHRQLGVNNVIVDAVLAIFKTAKKFNCEVKSVRVNSGRIWVDFKTHNDFDTGDVSQLGPRVAVLLQKITTELETIPPDSTSRWRDPFVLKSACLLAISSGLAINGAIQLTRLNYIHFPFTVDLSELFWDSIYLAAGILVVSLLGTIFLLGRSARTHLVMIELLLIGSFGAFSSVYTGLRDVNIDMDSSVGIVHHVQVYDKYINKGRRRSRTYLIYVNDWNSVGEARKIKVSRSFYNSVTKGNILLIQQKEGYLGYRWVEAAVHKVNY